MTDSDSPLRGSCLCGAVAWRVDGAALAITHCYCRMCQKQHGSPMATYLRVSADDLTLERGEESISSYASSESVRRRFCATCGSNLFFDYLPQPELAFVAAGTLDTAVDVARGRHIFMESLPPWHHVADDGLPRFEKYPTSEDEW